MIRASAVTRLSSFAGLPDWASFEHDIEVWWAYLDSLGVDETARQALFCLAQFSDEGYKKANAAISKLIKKTADQENVSNASALLHVMCKNARHEIDPQPEAKRWKPSSSW